MRSAIVRVAQLFVGTTWVGGAVWLYGWQHWNGWGCLIISLVGLMIVFGDPKVR